ncbi:MULTISPECIES: methylated-DNA--[protein]-cysteine S-methyltransferase [unclassified Alteromonas]|uniref:methylated-DNA--[protein]-cysteine S-methyltransferase n=1 Tax=unclassified Alteromonas TaxID=2614992 RepID=UPI00068CBBE4|nr:MULTISPECIES: methylated-DNA--[protein]-cysteine S-methyltransferase [unclassified Alteromonas]
MNTDTASEVFSQSIPTEQGVVTVTASNIGVTRIAFSEPEGCLKDSVKGSAKDSGKEGVPNGITEEACSQLSAYFAKTRHEFDLPIEVKGTEFQTSVWKALQSIPYGQTVSYLDIAKHIGNPKAVRAVGLANGKNPIAIVVPCHRVIGSNKTLTGYAGGLARKQFLLNLEGAQGGLWD